MSQTDSSAAAINAEKAKRIIDDLGPYIQKMESGEIEAALACDMSNKAGVAKQSEHMRMVKSIRRLQSVLNTAVEQGKQVSQHEGKRYVP